MTIDFGSEIGILNTSAQITTLYLPEDLIAKQIITVLNFPLKKIANIMSECLVIGIIVNANDVILMSQNVKLKTDQILGKKQLGFRVFRLT